MIEATVGMENTVTKNILSKFAQNQTALMTSVNLDILILVNLATDANSICKRFVHFSIFILQQMMTRKLKNSRKELIKLTRKTKL